MIDVSFHPEADAEYQAAIGWYAARSPAAGAGFVAAFERAVDGIRRFPDGHPAYDASHRFATLRRYPYTIVFRPGDPIRVVAVAHAGRADGYWHGRT